jgi:MATE family multidrug resistance protein
MTVTLRAPVTQDATIAAAASKCLIALAPALVFEATDQCCRLYLAAQSVVQPAVVTTLTATLLTPIYLHICCKW